MEVKGRNPSGPLVYEKSKRGDGAKHQTSIQQEIKKKLMFDVIVCVTKGSDSEGRQAARR